MDLHTLTAGQMSLLEMEVRSSIHMKVAFEGLTLHARMTRGTHGDPGRIEIRTPGPIIAMNAGTQYGARHLTLQTGDYLLGRLPSEAGPLPEGEAATLEYLARSVRRALSPEGQQVRVMVTMLVTMILQHHNLPTRGYSMNSGVEVLRRTAENLPTAMVQFYDNRLQQRDRVYVRVKGLNLRALLVPYVTFKKTSFSIQTDGLALNEDWKVRADCASRHGLMQVLQMLQTAQQHAGIDLAAVLQANGIPHTTWSELLTAFLARGY